MKKVLDVWKDYLEDLVRGGQSNLSSLIESVEELDDGFFPEGFFVQKNSDYKAMEKELSQMALDLREKNGLVEIFKISKKCKKVWQRLEEFWEFERRASRAHSSREWLDKIKKDLSNNEDELVKIEIKKAEEKAATNDWFGVIDILDQLTAKYALEPFLQWRNLGGRRQI